MEKQTSVKKNFIYNMFYQVLIMLVPLATTPYIARVLGANNVGIYNFVFSNMTYFTLIAVFGSISYAQREISSVRDNKELLSREFWGIFIFRASSTLIALIAFGIFMMVSKEYRIYYLCNSIAIIAVAFDISWFFQGIENFQVTVVRNTIIKLLATIAIFMFVKDEKDLIIYILINVGSTFIGNCSLWHFIRSYVYKFSFHYINQTKHFSGSLKLFIPVLAIQIYTVVDKTMLGILSGVEEVAYYSQAEKIIKLIIMMINALADVLLPRMSMLVANNQLEEANRYYRKSVSVSMLIVLPCLVGTNFIAEDFIPLFLGEGYESSVNVLKILSILFVILGLAKVIGTPLMIPLKMEKEYTIAVCAGAIINVSLNTILIPLYSAIGAAVATIFAEATVTFLEIWFIKEYFKPRIIITSIIRYLTATIPMICVLIIISLNFEKGILRLIVLIVSGILFYIVTLLLIKDRVLTEDILLPMINKKKKA